MEETQNSEPVSNGKSATKIIFPILLTLVVGAGAWYGISTYLFSKTHVETDNAQIDGNISPVIVRVPGYVREIHFDDNMPVKEGEIIISLDDREYQLRLQQAQAGLGAGKANVDVSKTGVNVTKAGLNASNANVAALKQNLLSAKEQIRGAEIRMAATEKEFQRFSNLLKEGATTQQVFDRVKTERDAAEVQLKVAQNQYDVLLKQVAAAENQANVTSQQIGTSMSQVALANTGLSARELDIELMKLNLSYTMVAAPISGTLARKNVQLGQYIQPGQTVFAIVNDSMFVTANFKETQIEKMKIGQKAIIVADAYPEVEIEGEVSSLSPATGAKFSLIPPDNATGNYTKVVQRVPVRLKIKTPEALKGKLKPGLSVKVTIKVS
jgi:membrane fusion protein (multidrug efflux system)